MIEDFIKFYSKNLTFLSIIKKHHGLSQSLLWKTLLVILFALLLFFMIIIVVAFTWLNLVITILLVALLVGYVYLSLFFNSQVIKAKYPDIYISKFQLPGKEIKREIFKNLEMYLENNGLRDSVDEIQSKIEKKAKNERLPFILFSSSFIALFLPLWNSYLDKVLDHFKSDVKNLTVVALLLLLVVFFIALYIIMFRVFKDTVIAPYYVKLNAIVELLDDYKLWKNSKKE